MFFFVISYSRTKRQKCHRVLSTLLQYGFFLDPMDANPEAEFRERTHCILTSLCTSIHMQTSWTQAMAAFCPMWTMGQDYGWPAWGPAIIAGAITIKCGPPRPPLTYAPSAKGPQTADHFLQEKILISLQTGGWPEHREACDRFFCKGGLLPPC